MPSHQSIGHEIFKGGEGDRFIALNLKKTELKPNDGPSSLLSVYERFCSFTSSKLRVLAEFQELVRAHIPAHAHFIDDCHAYEHTNCPICQAVYNYLLLIFKDYWRGSNKLDGYTRLYTLWLDPCLIRTDTGIYYTLSKQDSEQLLELELWRLLKWLLACQLNLIDTSGYPSTNSTVSHNDRFLELAPSVVGVRSHAGKTELVLKKGAPLMPLSEMLALVNESEMAQNCTYQSDWSILDELRELLPPHPELTQYIGIVQFIQQLMGNQVSHREIRAAEVLCNGLYSFQFDYLDPQKLYN
ncbi:hypothetical protein [Saccharospirillum impatiens]|uniref:hypothetical protein n=1 Tax=Saccharospirillum impatiens TaxID=169438 RepID=UPI0012F94A02|nr:hypothetical protein [Saccharospirillum impatiens]